MARSKTARPITDAVEILHRRYFEDKPEMLALLEEESQELVWLASSQMMKGANEELKAHASHTVEITGEWAERGGAKIFIIDSVQHISAN